MIGINKDYCENNYDKEMNQVVRYVYNGDKTCLQDMKTGSIFETSHLKTKNICKLQLKNYIILLQANMAPNLNRFKFKNFFRCYRVFQNDYIRSSILSILP